MGLHFGIIVLLLKSLFSLPLLSVPLALGGTPLIHMVTETLLSCSLCFVYIILLMMMGPFRDHPFLSDIGNSLLHILHE